VVVAILVILVDLPKDQIMDVVAAVVVPVVLEAPAAP
tara:strand:- start:329 stop:439 length:111 start_codon:yes stop_codon:yes gene_type:complete